MSTKYDDFPILILNKTSSSLCPLQNLLPLEFISFPCSKRIKPLGEARTMHCKRFWEEPAALEDDIVGLLVHYTFMPYVLYSFHSSY